MSITKTLGADGYTVAMDPAGGVIPRAITGPNGEVSGLQAGSSTFKINSHSIGNRCILLGDSMTLAHNQVLAAASATFSRTSNVATVSYTSHGLISGQLITVNGFASSYGFNANRVEVTWISANAFSYPNPGADIGATAGTVSTSTNPIVLLDRADNRGWVHHANSKLNGGLQIVNNAGVGGDTFAMMIARLATDVDAFDFDILFLHGGYNGLNDGNTAATEWASCKQIIDKYIGLGKTVVLVTVLPVGTSNANAANTTFQTRLSELRRLQLNYSRPGLITVDGYLDSIDPSNANGCSLANMTGDGTHPTAKLARLIGTRVYNAINGKQPFPDIRAVSAADNYATHASSNQLLNAGWAGTGGTNGSANFTYTSVPAGMKVDYGGSITSGTVTGAARSDGFGYDANIASCVCGGAATPRVGSLTIPAGSYAVGDEIITVCEVTISGDPGNIKGVYAALQQNHTTQGNGYAYALASSSTAADFGVADGTYLLVTPPMKVITGVNYLAYNAIVDVGAAGTITNIKFGRLAVYKNILNNRS